MNKQVIANGQWFIDQLNVYQSANSDYLSIKNNFIVRHNEFEIIISSLKSKDVNDPLQNELILGRRGSGKSTLLKRIEIEIADDKELNSKYIPVNLAEEQAGIYRLFDLWEEVLKEMSHQLGIQFSLKDFSFFKQEQDYTRYLYQSIHETAISQNKKIVLLLDNFDRIVENFTDDGNLLRETLINFNDLVIIAGSTRMDEHFWGYDMPFYDFFRKHRLEALDKEELYKLLNHWSDALNIPQLKEFIANNPGKIENIRLLTDGLPRTIQFFIQMVLQDAHSHSYDYLKKIMDNVTPLYQERLNHQTPQLRKIILEMAFIWEACNTKQLVEKCKMESKLISANLKTLVDRGIVDKIETSKKNHLYRISERFFNMWLIITQGNPEQKRKAKWLSIFLENWYDAIDLRRLARNHIKLLQGRELEQKDAIILSKGLSQCKYITVKERDEIIALTEKLIISTESNMMMLPDSFVKIYNTIVDLMNHQKFASALECANSIENEEDGNKFLLLGRIYLTIDKYREALMNFKNARKKGNHNALYYLGVIHQKIKQYAQAEKYYLMSIEQGDENAFNNLALLYDSQNKYSLAEKYYLMAIEQGDENALNNLALHYNNQERYPEAEKYFLMSVEQGDENAIFNLALFYKNCEKYPEAEKYFLIAVEHGNENALYNLALLYNNQEKFSLAEKYYLMAIETGNEKAMNNLALLYNNQEKLPLAEKYYLMAIEKGNETAMNNLAILYNKQEKFPLAEKYFLMAVEQGDKSAIFNLALLYDNQDKYQEAEKYYLMAIDFGDEDATYNLALLYDIQEKFPEAEEYYLMVIEKGVEKVNGKAIKNLASLYLSQKKYPEAEKYFLMAVDKGIEEVNYSLGLLYLFQEKYPEAEKYLLMAVEEVNEAVYILALFYDSQEKYTLAEKYYSLAIEKGINDALSDLAVINYKFNKNKEKSLDLFKRASSAKHNIANQKNLLIAEIWNGIFDDTEERTKAIIREGSDELYEFIIDLLIHQQKVLVMKLFNDENFGKTLQEKYHVLYYVCLWLNKKADENLDLRIPPEIRTTVDEVLAEIDKKERFYRYK